MNNITPHKETVREFTGLGSEVDLKIIALSAGYNVSLWQGICGISEHSCLFKSACSIPYLSR